MALTSTWVLEFRSWSHGLSRKAANLSTRLPEGHAIDCVGLPTDGQAYGCFSETLLLGFEGQNSSFARGTLRPEQVERTLNMAALYGFELGDFRLDDSSYPAECLPGTGNGTKGQTR